ncbi:MAG: hypothetical protein R3F56_10815 [Planctomycetota bacterium]
MNLGRCLRLGPPLVVAILGLAAGTTAQSKPKLPRWRIDPHTDNDPKALAKAGYVSYGPFPFGERGPNPATSEDIDKHLEYEKFLWVETAHFKIGSALPAWNVPLEPKIRDKIRTELTELSEKLPRVNVKTRTLTPWLRLHLLAHRSEKSYRAFQDMLGVKDEDFPADKASVIVGNGRFMGYGKYLGMREKYLLLITEKGATCEDYLKSFIGRDTSFGQRWHFIKTGALMYAVGTTMEDGRLKDDTALHAHLEHCLVHNFIDGYRSYSYDTPVWITEGLAHWFERRISERFNSFCRDEGAAHNPSAKWNWKPDVRAAVTAGKVRAFAEVMTWRQYSAINWPDNEFLWSRWDYLLATDPQKFGDFMLQVKGRVNPKDWSVDQSDIIAACREALRTVYGLTPLTFDEKWAEWVKTNYPSQ